MDDTGGTPSGGAESGGSATALTFQQAFAADTSPVSDSTSAAATAEATGSPTGAESTPGDETRSPYIPRERFDSVNARMQAAEQKAQALAWAESIDQQSYAEQQQWWARAQQDPDGFLTETLLEHPDSVALLEKMVLRMQAHPEHGAKLASFAAKQLAARRQSAPPAEPQMVPVQLEDGSVVNMPRDPAEWLAFHQRQWMGQVDERLAPALSAAQQLQAEKAEAVQQQQVAQYATSTLRDVSSWPGMESPETRRAVAEKLSEMPVRGNDPRDVSLALNAAYRAVVMPKLASSAQSSLLDSLERKGAAAVGVNPGNAASSTPRDVRSFRDPRLKW